MIDKTPIANSRCDSQVTDEERQEGDAKYMAPELLQGVFTKSADVFRYKVLFAQDLSKALQIEFDVYLFVNVIWYFTVSLLHISFSPSRCCDM